MNSWQALSGKKKVVVIVRGKKRGKIILIFTFLVLAFSSGSFGFVQVKKIFSTENDTTNFSIDWDRTYGGTGAEYLTDVIETAEGDFVICAYTESYGVGNGDIWLLKIDASGTILWNQTYGGNAPDRATAFIHTNDGGFVLVGSASYWTGEETIPIKWLWKIDGNGTMVWNHTYYPGLNGDKWGDPRDFDPAYSREEGIYDVIQTSDGNYVLVGETGWYKMDIMSGRKVWLAKANSSGILLWNRTYEGYNGYGVQQTPDGGFIIGAHFYNMYIHPPETTLIKTDAEGTPQWQYRYGEENASYSGDSLIQTDDQGFVFSGHITPFGDSGGSGYSYSMSLVKTDSDGELQWRHVYPIGSTGPIISSARKVIQTVDQGFALVGHDGCVHGLLVKTDTDGILIWGKDFQSANASTRSSFSSILQSSNGQFLVAGIQGVVKEDFSYQYDLWLVKITAWDSSRSTSSMGWGFLIGALSLVFLYRRLRSPFCSRKK